MDSEFLSVRLSKDDAQVIQRLHQQTGLSKSEIVNRALRSLARADATATEGGLFELGVRPMDLAAASLVWLANKTDITDIITVDRADFAVYRTSKRKSFRNVFVA